MQGTAVISRCKHYRYQLTRVWDVSKPEVCFIMLNPSKADATKDDPTVRRCIDFAQRWGFGGLKVVNLFAYRTAYPLALKDVVDAIGPRNAYYLRKTIRTSSVIVCAWGNKMGRPEDHKILPKANYHYLELSKDGTPKHPLYLKSDLTPIRFL